MQRSHPHVHEQTEGPRQSRQALGHQGCRAGDRNTLPVGRRTQGRGQGLARRGAAPVARRLEDDQRSPRPGGAVERIERGAPARAGPDPLRAHGGVALCLLSRLGRADGRRPRHHAELRPARAGLRRRAPDELRRLRHAGAQHRLRHQRPGRDAAGTLRMGPQAPGRQHRDRGAAPGPARQRCGARGHRPGARVPRTHDRLRVDARARRLVRQDRHAALRRPIRRPSGDEGGTQARRAAHRGREAQDRARPPLSEAGVAGRGAAAHQGRAAADLSPERRAGAGHGLGLCAGLRGLPRDAARAHAHAVRPLPLLRPGDQGRRRRQRRHGVRGGAVPGGRRRPAVPADQGGAGLGAGALRRQEPACRTTASA